MGNTAKTHASNVYFQSQIETINNNNNNMKLIWNMIFNCRTLSILCYRKHNEKHRPLYTKVIKSLGFVHSTHEK